jgi:CubicO group peptidase (beta-lactamase class C family)
MKKTVLPWLCMLIILFTKAQSPGIIRPDGNTISTSRIDQLVTSLMDTAAVTGLEIGVVSDDKVAYVKGYGYRDKASKLLNDTSTCFYGASLAKSLFAYLVMQLVDEKKILLDKPIYQYLPKPLPEYEKYRQLAGDERYKLITPRMCLDHTTGLPNWRELNNGKLDIGFTPGSRYSYSGEGIMLLQLVVETVTGRPLAGLARERIFSSLGMTRSDFVWQPRFETDYARGHNLNGDTLPEMRYREAYAAGSMETTAADYSRFMAAVLQGQGLSPAARKEMLWPQIAITGSTQAFPDDTSRAADNRKIGLAYGLGWGLFQTPFGKAFFKEGHIDGWMHYVIGFPDKKFALVILGNSSNSESIYKELVEKLTGVTIPWYWEHYIPYRPNLKLSEAVLSQYAGVYDGKLNAIVTVENGHLKVESPTVQLGKTTLYATSDHHFYLKIMETDIDFVKDAQGKVIKAVLDDEGEHYELTKVK